MLVDWFAGEPKRNPLAGITILSVEKVTIEH